MCIGLKRGCVLLVSHEDDWENSANTTIKILYDILGNNAKDIQHVGSTSIKHIKAKPIIDIAIAVEDFQDVLEFEKQLQNKGFYYRPDVNITNQLLFACGNYYDGTGDLQTHFIHVVLKDSIEWKNYIKFKDYLNSHIEIAKEYERVKTDMYVKYPNDRSSYLKGKEEIINSILEKASE